MKTTKVESCLNDWYFLIEFAPIIFSINQKAKKMAPI